MWETSLPERRYSELSIEQESSVSYRKTQSALEVKTNFHMIGAETSGLISVHLTRNTETSEFKLSMFQWLPNSLKGSSKTKGNYENKTMNFSNQSLGLNPEKKLAETGPCWIARTGYTGWFCINLGHVWRSTSGNNLYSLYLRYTLQSFNWVFTYKFSLDKFSLILQNQVPSRAKLSGSLAQRPEG